MQRNVIQQNQTTFAISLPKKWIEKNNIKKAEKLNLNEINNNLIISKVSNNHLECKVDLKNITEPKERIIRIVLNNLYRKGYDEIHLLINEKDKYIIKNLIENNNLFVGFEISDETKNTLTLFSFSEAKKEQFDIIYHKITLICKELLSFDFEKITDNKIQIIEKHSQFLRRVVYKENLSEQYIDILRYLTIISHAIQRVFENKLEINNNKLKEDLLKFYTLVFRELINDKSTFMETQKLYLEIENEFKIKKCEKSDIHLWEIARSINLAAMSISYQKLSHIIS